AHCTATESDLLHLHQHRVSPRPHIGGQSTAHRSPPTPSRLSGASRRHSPYGSRTRLCTVKGCRPKPIDERATCHSGNGIRTRVPALRGLCPSPLDDTAACPAPAPPRSTAPFRRSRRPGG